MHLLRRLRLRTLPGALALALSAMGCDRQAASVESSQPRAAGPAQGAAAGAPVAASAERARGGGGASDPALTPALGTDPAQRIFSRGRRTWIYSEPDGRSPRLGYLRAGGSAALAGPPVTGRSCSGGFHPVLPRGFVCLNRRATLNPLDPLVQLLQEYPPDLQRRLPYFYGTVRNPGPVYGRLPSAEEVASAEPGFTERYLRWLGAEGEVGAGYAQHVWLEPGQELVAPTEAFERRLTQGVPQGLQAALPLFSGRTRDPDKLVLESMRPKVGYGIVHTFLSEGRRYGLTTGLSVVPTDRLRPIQGSDFHGVRIGEDIEFPFALVRRVGAHFQDGSAAPYRATLALTGKQRFFGTVLHYETRAGAWISDRVASRVLPARKMPGWAKRGEKWIDINLSKQVLMLYEGETPVFATLVSSGEAGLEDPTTSTATKRGIFRIHTKHATATMSSKEVGEEFELQDVPYVMYFDKEGYALHGAYWHDRFGTPKSHGCINLAPDDARRVFAWADPQLPVGWHGVMEPLTGTVVFVHP